MPSWDDFVDWIHQFGAGEQGRRSLRRRWTNLRALADIALARLDPVEVRLLLHKEPSRLDPEQNDLKAVVAYAIGRGVLPDSEALISALTEDERADPLAFLAQHSGKAFGEKYAALITEFWLSRPGDGWAKIRSSGFYDIEWRPSELRGDAIRIELKASSEHPNYRFQQVRHPMMSGTVEPDYDLLLCLGVTAGALEWWAIPALELDRFACNGVTEPNCAIISRHHGKARSIWCESEGYKDEGWFSTDARARELLGGYGCADSERLRDHVLSSFAN